MGSAWSVIAGGTKIVEVLVVRTSVVVGIPLMVVSTGVRVVMTLIEALKVWARRAGLTNDAVITVTEALKLWVLSAGLTNGPVIASVAPPMTGLNGWIMPPVDALLAKT